VGHTHRDSFAVSHGVTGDVTAFGIVIDCPSPAADSATTRSWTPCPPTSPPGDCRGERGRCSTVMPCRLAGHQDVWIATLGEIAAAWREPEPG